MSAESPPIALVTGAGRGIGRGIATRLAADGYLVAVNDIDGAAANEVARLVGGVALPGDLADAEVIDEVVGTAESITGSLRAVVNNAGIESRSPIRDHSLEAWRQVLDVNLTAAFLVVRRAANALAASGSGAIVNVASIAATGSAGQVAYDTSKGGLMTLTRSLAMELGPEGVRANSVCPGFIETPMLAEHDLRDLAARAARKLPLRRVGRVEDVAAAVAWLLSDDASYVTGHALYVDGGYVRA